ncbi:DNA-processing protein DprA [Simiduia sp. 21SJ11W-1]|uniref:DNA-processing protein DprA n=1 Tax=Simiduia sp. 21SJ11W-1 TaxID=2909669 RepID=UPI0020A0D4B7|nr:DNA-processing protein DprA [Simiduia sp. 21SJ11W-1]UTA47920.1 DNA-processing protein DprA [Simiduia sp. 21SJ11W-1]
MAHTPRELLIALHHIPGLGPRKWREITENFADPLEILHLDHRLLSQLMDANGATLLLDWLHERPGNWLGVRLARLQAWLQAPSHHVITQLDNNYPNLLREAKGPLLLHVAGNAQVLALPQIAVVGTRKPTAAGKQTARTFARELAAGGFTISSGLALGIDGIAHESALEVGGTTLAVLGSGLDNIYPARHRRLAERIVGEGGALVSEFGLDVQPAPGHFPRRNRIISGLSLGTLVVEAALKSGSLITARLALEQNREVFAIPGSLYSDVSEGCNWLIREGAQLVTEPAQLVAQLGAGLEALSLFDQKPAMRTEVSTNKPTAPKEFSALLAALGTERLDFEQLLAATGLGVPQLTQLLNAAELAGVIVSSECGYERTY